MSQVSENKMVEDPCGVPHSSDDSFRVPHPGDVGKTVWVRDSEDPNADDAVWRARTLVAVLPDAQPGDTSHRSFICAVQGKTAKYICQPWRFALISKDHPMAPQPEPSPAANAKLVRICENPTHPFAETDHGRVVQAAYCRIKVAPIVKESLTVDTPDPAKITIGYTVPNAYEAGAEPIAEPIQRKPVLYIAGPMRGIAFFNYPMFDRVAKNLREAGNEVISPADEDRKQDGFDPFANPEYANPDACVFPKEMDFSKTVRRCLDAVLRCDEIVLLPGWENSNGAVAELTLAMWLGKRVRHLRISDCGGFSWVCYRMGLAGLAVQLRDHHIPEDAAPASVVVDEDDEDEDILDTAARITRGDRNASYGPPDQDFRRTAGMWSALFAVKLKEGVTFEPKDIALAMILLKCSRESHQPKRDNWADIAGYSRCGSMCN